MKKPLHLPPKSSVKNGARAMIWVHCGGAECVTSTQSLVARLAQADESDGVLVSAEQDVLDTFGPFPRGVKVDIIPQDTSQRCKVFLDDWNPTYLIWNGGVLRPNLLRNVQRADIAASLINTNVNSILGGGARWIPRAARTAVQAFERVLTSDGATATRLRRGGVPAERVQATGPILEEPLPLTYNQHEFTVMAEAVGARPVWHAANVSAGEVKHMAAAHLAASRKSHRMMMVLTPNDIESGPEVADTLREAGLLVGLRSDGDEPTLEMQAYITDLPDELGLWYRIAPLTFIGGTLGGGSVASPLDPIVLGSAIVHGTRKAPHQARFKRLSGVEACREVRSAGELGIAIATLSSPEQYARMGLAGWEEMTRTANIANTLIGRALEQVELTRGTG